MTFPNTSSSRPLRGLPMKRDLGLLRAILLHVEAGASARALPGAGTECTSEHLRILTEAGFIQSSDLGNRARSILVADRLTSAGHDFLDAAPNQAVWDDVLQRMQKQQLSLPLAGLQATLRAAIQAQLHD